MSLRRQLLLVSLLLLSIPWAGCQFVREIELALRDGRQNAVAATGEAMASLLRANPDWLMSTGHQESANDALYAFRGAGKIVLDGYDSEWPAESLSVQVNSGDATSQLEYKARLTTVNKADYLHIHFSIEDPDVVYHNPRVSWLGSGDRLVVLTHKDNLQREYVFATSAPGLMQARYHNDNESVFYEPRIQAYWLENETGYTIEVQLPLHLAVQRLGFLIINQSGIATNARDTVAGRIGFSHSGVLQPPVFPSTQLSQLIASFPAYPALSILDNRARPLAGPGTEPGSSWISDKYQYGYDKARSNVGKLRRFIYRSILRDDELPSVPPVSASGKISRPEVQAALSPDPGMTGDSVFTPQFQWYDQAGLSSTALLSAAIPVVVDNRVRAIILVEQSSDQFLSLTDKAFGDLVFYSLLVMLICSAGLLMYASILSLRIRRLSQAAVDVINSDGSLQDNFPTSTRKDEIGDLTRSYGELLTRLASYTDYLRTLSGKLTHELRTPIAIVSSSLENLEEVHETQAEEQYLIRAREGLERLRRILTAMTEATNLAESIDKNPLSHVDLANLAKEMCAVHAALNPKANYSAIGINREAEVMGNADLLQQMLDKLLDNAADFCPPGGDITLRISCDGDTRILEIINQGPALPTGMEHQVFDSMVSLRQHSEDDVHLGLGLHIVALITRFHGATIDASNLPDGSGVSFTIRFPHNYSGESI